MSKGEEAVGERRKSQRELNKKKKKRRIKKEEKGKGKRRKGNATQRQFLSSLHCTAPKWTSLPCQTMTECT
jgi:hypothetical protein